MHDEDMRRVDDVQVFSGCDLFVSVSSLLAAFIDK